MIHKKYQVYLSVSCKGPLLSDEVKPALEDMDARPRALADLVHANADVDFFEDHWKGTCLNSSSQELLLRLREPSRRQVIDALAEIDCWLSEQHGHDDWDGGQVTFAFAGHGRAGDGALVLKDGHLTWSDLLNELCGSQAVQGDIGCASVFCFTLAIQAPF